MLEVIPGILEKEWSEIERKIELVRLYVSTIHVDIIDGKFINNTTFLDPAPFKKYTKDIFFELHMMVEEPINYLDSWAAAGFKRFVGHIEKMSSQAEFIEKGQLLGEVGLAVDGPTSVDGITIPYDELDTILVMTIKAGVSGQPFIKDYLKKVEALRQKTTIPIEVDGGINDMTITEAKNAGASRFVSTSYLFRSDNIRKAIDQLRTSSG